MSAVDVVLVVGFVAIVVIVGVFDLGSDWDDRL